MPRFPRLNASEIERVILAKGFVLTRSRGSHRVYRHVASGRRVTIAFHGAQPIPLGTLRNILREAGIERDELDELLKK